MEEKLNWGAVVSITNRERTLFYLQQKDEEYWIPENRLRYCFFGGGVKRGENELEALQRELLEEFDERSALVISKNSKKLFDAHFKNILNEPYKISLYESVLEDEFLRELPNLPVKEGIGRLVKREGILQIPFFLDLKKPVLDRYLRCLPS